MKRNEIAQWCAIATLFVLSMFVYNISNASVAGYSYSTTAGSCIAVSDNAQFETLSFCQQFNVFGGSQWNQTREIIRRDTAESGTAISETVFTQSGGNWYYDYAFHDATNNCGLTAGQLVTGAFWTSNPPETPLEIYQNRGWVKAYAYYSACMVELGSVAGGYELRQDGYVYAVEENNEPTLPPLPPNEECAINNLLGCLTFLFFPSETQLAKFSGLGDLVSTKVPFGYFTLASESLNQFILFEGVNSQTEPWRDVPVLQTMRESLGYILWVFFAVYFFKRIQHLQL